MKGSRSARAAILRKLVAMGLILAVTSACTPPTPTRSAAAQTLAALPLVPATGSPAETATLTPVPTARPTSTPLPGYVPHRIGVRVMDGVGEFYDRTTGEKFVPRGYNYVRLAPMYGDSGRLWEATLSPGLYDPALAEEALRQMHADGYHVVRVVVDCCRASNNVGRPGGGISSSYLDNVIDFLNKAKANDVFVLLVLHLIAADGGYNQLWASDPAVFYGANLRYLTAGGFQAKRSYDQQVIISLIGRNAPLDAVFAYDLTDDVVYEADQPPLTLKAGLVSTANGKTYDMAKPQDKELMMKENLVYWIDQQRAAILQVDPTALVTVSFPAFIADSRPTYPEAAIWESTADFIDLHVYAGQGWTLEDYADQFGINGMAEKPILMGQLSAYKPYYASAASAALALQEWQGASCEYGFDGWLLWLRGSEEYTVLYNGLSDGGAINAALAPLNRPDPCQRGATSGPHPDWTAYTNANRVNAVAVEGDGNLWVAAGPGGAVRWGADGTYAKYTTADGLASNGVGAVAVAPDGSVWFGAGKAVARFDGETWTTHTSEGGLLDAEVKSITAASDGAVWVGTELKGVSRFDGRQWKTFTTDDGLADDHIQAIAAAPDGSVWIGTPKGVSRFDGISWKTYTTADGLTNNNVFCVAVAPDGVVWFCTGAGLSRFSGDKWTTYPTLAGLPDNQVYAAAAAPGGVLWLSTDAGISRLDANGTITYAVEGDASKSVRDSVAVAPDGLVWFSAGYGVSHFDGENWTTYVTADGLAANRVTSVVAAADGALWFGLDGNLGVSRFDGQTWKTYTSADGLAGNSFIPIVAAPDGSVWFGGGIMAAMFGGGEGEGAVTRFDGARWKTYTTADGLGNGAVTFGAVAPDGDVWFGTAGGGVSRFDGKRWQTYTTADGLAGNIVISVAATPDGVLWFGTDQGVSRFDGETWTTYTTADGLAANVMLSIAAAPDGIVWAGTENAISRFDGEQWTTYTHVDRKAVNGRIMSITVAPDGSVWFAGMDDGVLRFDGQNWMKYSTADGLAHNWVYSIAAAPDGALWFATFSGVSRFAPTLAPSPTSTPAP